MKKGISKVITRIFVLALGVVFTVAASAALAATPANTFSQRCTNIIVGKDATVDGSTIGTYCCDGALYAEVKVVPGRVYRPGKMMPIYYRPFPWNYDQYLEYLDEEELVGLVPQVRRTYRYVDIRVWYDDQHVGGINEYGVTVGETTINGRPELSNEKGIFGAYTNYPESSLLTLALQRAKTAREAIQVMGSLAEEYGYHAPMGSEHITVTDGDEAWAFEILGPGPDWEPGCGKPGAVWCAQRIPDGHVGVSANRSRIGEVPLEETDYFMFSPNIRSLALEKGWWDGVEPFVWYDAYAPSAWPNLREWRVLSLIAPSLGLDPTAVRWPFSVKPDEKVSVQDIMAIHRDTYEGTDYDVTEDPAFYLDGKKSPMACPFGPRDLHNLLDVKATRGVATSSSVFSYVSQVRADLPKPIKGCMWFGFGPAASTCYLPLYSGVTKLPESWGDTELTRVDREDSWWAFNLVDTLPLIKWQDAIEDIRDVREPAEACFFENQPDFENAVVKLYFRRWPGKAKKIAQTWVTQYTNACMNAVSDGYWELVDYLLFKYYFQGSWGAPQERPSIDCPPYLWHKPW
jgi:dipeptidase